MALSGSIQSSLIPTTQLPLASLLRPIPPVIDPAKVDSMVETLSGKQCTNMPSPAPEVIEPGKLPPVDVLHYRSSAKDGSTAKDFYFAFGGCHRLQAYEKAGREMVDVR